MTTPTSPNTLSQMVAANVRRLRITKGINAAEMAAGLTQAGWPVAGSQVDRIETGARRLSVDELAILAQLFGVEPWSLTQQPSCDACLGAPPAGFTCNACGATK